MLTILDFSWRDFEPEIVAAPRVRDLVELATMHDPNLFVVHDRVLRWTAVAIPDSIIEVADRLDLPGAAAAASVGLVDLLRRQQMTVLQDCPASLAARMAGWQEASVVHVVDDEGAPRGIFMPAVVAERLPGASMVRNASLVLQAAVNVPPDQLDRAIAAVEAELDTFHSEGLNLNGPSPYICSDHGLRHSVTFCPCDRHPQAACGRREVAARRAALA